MRMDGRRVCCVETVGEPVLKRGRVPGEEKVFVEVRRRYGVVEGSGDGEAVKRMVEGVEGAVAVDEVRRLVFMRERKGEGKAKKEEEVKSVVKGRSRIFDI